MNILEIKYRWGDVQSSPGYNYSYPGELSAHMKEQYSRPAIYRWMVWAPTVGIDAFYIGETEDLARRVKQYLYPGPRQATNLRLQAYFDEALKRQQTVNLQTFEFDPFQINKVDFSMELLGHTHVRRTLENLVLVWLHPTVSSPSPLILNRVLTQDLERSKKRTNSALVELKKLGLTGEQINRVLETVKLQKTKT